VDERQVPVEHNHVVGIEAGLVERARAVVGDVDGHALAAQAASHGVGNPAFVLGDEHTHLAQGSRRALSAGDVPLRTVAA
jgi:hypothetical protein